MGCLGAAGPWVPGNHASETPVSDNGISPKRRVAFRNNASFRNAACRMPERLLWLPALLIPSDLQLAAQNTGFQILSIKNQLESMAQTTTKGGRRGEGDVPTANGANNKKKHLRFAPFGLYGSFPFGAAVIGCSPGHKGAPEPGGMSRCRGPWVPGNHAGDHTGVGQRYFPETTGGFPKRCFFPKRRVPDAGKFTLAPRPSPLL